MNGLASMIQDKCVEVYDENYGESKIKTIKAVLAAMLSGAIDGMIVSWPFMYGALVHVVIKNNKKSK